MFRRTARPQPNISNMLSLLFVVQFEIKSKLRIITLLYSTPYQDPSKNHSGQLLQSIYIRSTYKVIPSVLCSLLSSKTIQRNNPSKQSS